MSKLDKIKAEIAFHEKMFFAALAVVIGLIGWSASNFLNTSAFILLLALFGMLASSIFGVFQYRFIKRLIEELDDA
jgi:thiol:disulfide interchange protein